ncbi:MAG: hypothetical protein M3552_15125 [Planctomycetota bacterium]|nr:hypothetical protein [Planctomycetaceae bacterium]MDQ3331962.1 hypothetical protein [Planctomycetota bacterium]
MSGEQEVAGVMEHLRSMADETRVEVEKFRSGDLSADGMAEIASLLAYRIDEFAFSILLNIKNQSRSERAARFQSHAGTIGAVVLMMFLLFAAFAAGVFVGWLL